MGNVLVVGGAGYVGGGMVDELAAAGHHVRVYDSLLYETVYLKPVDFVRGDVRDRRLLAAELAAADAVVWLAALVGDGACAHDAALTREINVEAVRWLAAHYDRRIVFMSTCSVYGAQDGLLIEDSPTQPLSLYAATKLEAEALLLPAGAVIFRLGTLFGLGDTYSRIRLDLVLNSLTVKACRHGRIRVFGGEQHRPLLHVKDVAEAVVAALDADCSGVFNLHASNLRIVELARLVQAQVPGAEVHTTPIRLEDARNYRVSSDKARAAFGFEPRRAPEQGIDEIRRLVVEGRIRDLASPRFSNTDHLRPMLVADSTDLGAEVSPGLEGHRRW